LVFVLNSQIAENEMTIIIGYGYKIVIELKKNCDLDFMMQKKRQIKQFSRTAAPNLGICKYHSKTMFTDIAL
jgi:hypothetical protein